MTYPLQKFEILFYAGQGIVLDLRHFP